MDSSLQRILTIGFVWVGHWECVDGSIDFVVTQHAKAADVLYAFTVDGQLQYIGKSVRTLHQRIYGYKKPGPTQSTNFWANRQIMESLQRGQSIEIYALPDNGLLHYGGFHVNLAAGLEDSLIRDLRPPWNGVRKK